ncbi:ABC transporter ATP-binding protein [Pseudomonas sp. UBA7530]|jgi:oligopeptide/dipeptide ABC transporter ATP-binding protein|uniref:ABC transporter ATP-binding protein n=1 Tax=Pseudomonas sp. UBA7530 TaxID=1947341 RepID=UPI0025E10996|nr:ABC transporter ATP-binding protein [Pseudomonas sp. UBA7530]
MNPILQVNQVTKTFPIAGSKKTVCAVNNVSFDLSAGETLGLVGESGSGKSTVGRCVMGLTGIDSGTILFEGQDLLGLLSGRSRDLLGQVQIVFQEPGESLNPRMRVAACIEEPLLALGIEKAERNRRVAAAIEEVALPAAVAQLSSADLSAGQQQRVAIARAMVTNPKLLVLDEPTSALDPTARASIIELLMRIQRERGTAYLFISHDLSTVRFISHRIAVMYLGQIVELGTATDIFSRPGHPYTAGLLSSILLPNPSLRLPARISLAGEIPSPIDLPEGCFLASRCPMAVAKCTQAPVAMASADQGHEVRCLRHADLRRSQEAKDVYQQFQYEAERILSIGAPERSYSKTSPKAGSGSMNKITIV